MIKIQNCPSMLLRGYSTYSPTAIKKLFDGHKIPPFLDFGIEEFGASEIATHLLQVVMLLAMRQRTTPSFHVISYDVPVSFV